MRPVSAVFERDVAPWNVTWRVGFRQAHRHSGFPLGFLVEMCTDFKCAVDVKEALEHDP